ncbi:protein MODIFIED TRANSPORT TO THE VACUOLE 1-like isoform X2 [Xenia sp. Carnegie-2017]|uniref:protein MODIFIED TRANSPORT TO THE VACUOLE 1-like isoform X2 n=1 Tax=Xenia sp. Carnegie-2017 TaxID=2897299 RepID=UPI001F045458|nr:protein MODIFIED TRANSPORT TO THE VACUOLE 1-like isoform X2 [Xenia sp. Carnegie-2017]
MFAKVLHIMKYLVVNGHAEFRSQLRRNGNAIKKSVDFLGDFDPIHGDGLNIKVRQAASDLEKLLFDVDNPDVEVIYKSMLASECSKKMDGFGYSKTPEPQQESSLMETLKTKVINSTSEMFNISRPAANHSNATPDPHHRYTPVDLRDTDIEIENFEISTITNEKQANSDNLHNKNDDLDVDRCYYERRLVNRITSGNGITNVPDRESLKDFLSEASSLDLCAILDLLDEKMKNFPVNVQLKTLHVLECLLRSKFADVPRKVKEHCPNISSLAESPDISVQAKAKKIVLCINSSLEEDLGNSLVPPGYEESKELPKIDTPQLNSLFTGMNVKDNGLDKPATDCKDTGVLSHVSASETICTLVDLVDTVPTEQISVNVCTDMSEEKIRQSSSVSVDKIPSNFQFLTFEAEGKYLDNNLTDETVNSFSNERDLLDLQSSCTNMVENGQNVTSQISENLLLMDSVDNLSTS